MTDVSDQQLEIRYEDLPEGGGSIWVRCMSRFYREPRDTYSDYWVCVWSTAGGVPGRGLTCASIEFMTGTRPGPPIPNPYVPGISQADPSFGARHVSTA